ncbi:hypothetical protein [Selenihalanaerobacter shriftii]|uniref:Lipoprotein n=1 Tax=Selenihalanaerobacter shriftii TaxID=142842 RepID=A0A1T4JJ41_9FIRM|nr:hypothetical protein [Selenihalanaerobacter shriftii]SJZ30185.1 hypothetical protein SAMN02745118_00004 [Selenihalanaerobacter shriftii]
MAIMKWLNIISGICSIISLFISCFVANKVVKISKELKIDSSTNVGKQTTVGKENTVVGRDMK